MYQVDFHAPCKAYFMGIGGISMSGLAEILLQADFQVLGSDMKESDIVNTLRELGATIYIGQVTENITSDIDFVVYGCENLLQLEEELAGIDTLRKIDIFDYDSINNPFLLEDIKKYGKQIY